MLHAIVVLGVPLVSLGVLTVALAGSVHVAVSRLALVAGTVAYALIAGATIGILGAGCGRIGGRRGRLLLGAVVLLPWMIAAEVGARVVVDPRRARGGALVHLEQHGGRVTADVDPRLFGPRSNGPPSVAPREPILVLDRVHARDAAAPKGKARGRLDNLSLALPGGVHAILGSPEDGTLALAEIIGGAKKPTRGMLRILGRDPYRFAAVRARIGVLGAEPRLPPVATVADAVRVALRARGEAPAGIDAVLDSAGTLAAPRASDPIAVARRGAGD